MKKFWMLMTAGVVCAACGGPGVKPAIPSDAEVEAKVEKVLKQMTLEEKAGQLVQLNITTIFTDGQLDTAKLAEMVGVYKVGSFLNAINDQAQPHTVVADVIRKIQEVSLRELHIPCIYGLDEIHGSTYVSDGVLFPQEINLAATFNREHAAAMGRAIAYETRSALVPWVFSPVMDLGRDPRWPRMWESWGEDSYLQEQMAVAEVLAMQGPDPNHIDGEHVGVSIKHYMAYGAPWSGKDRTPAYLSPSDLREKYFRPFKSCIQAGALNMMINSASINGVPMHANKTLLTGWVKEELNWDGMMVTDWADIDNLYTREHVATDKKDALAMGINAGIDMVMDPYDPETAVQIRELVQEGRIPMARLDDAVRRILRMKVRLGLFDQPVWDNSGFAKTGGEEFRAQALAAALESEVLLKNEGGILPLRKGTRILVTGPNAHSMRTLNGGWSYTWQGVRADDFAEEYNTILEAVRNRFGEDCVTYATGVVYDDVEWEKDHAVGIDRAVAAAAGADVILACIGENSYCETPGNTNDLNLSENQRQLVRALAATGKPVILVLNEGRPRILGDIEPLAKAVVDIMLPGNHGADALAMLLSGDANFSGKLPFTYPRHINALHNYDYKVSENVATMGGLYNYDAVMDVQWPFGHGLSYTEFAYSGLKVSQESFQAGDTLTFEVTVTNKGQVAGQESVLLYSSDLVASLIPDVKRLRQFTKVSLAPGASTVVRLEVPAKELAFVGADGKWRLEAGDFRIAVGSESLMIRCTQTKVWDSPNID